MALSAMAKETDEYADILRQLFLYRFDKGEGLEDTPLEIYFWSTYRYFRE